MSGDKKGRFWRPVYVMFDATARIIGFAVDAVAMASLLLAINMGSPIVLTPLHALFIWCIAVFTYFSLLQIYWRREVASKSEKTFRLFLGGLPSENLLLLLPLVVAAIFAILILGEMSRADRGATLLVIYCIAMVYVFLNTDYAYTTIELIIKARHPEWQSVRKFNASMDGEWSFWGDLITARLDGRRWVMVESFSDVMVEWDVSPGSIHRLFARYALNHPRSAYYGIVLHEEEGEWRPISEYRVLVNLELLGDEYRYL